MELGEEESVLFREVSLFQGLKSTQTWYILGEEESVLFREVSLFQGLKSTQTWYSGRKKVSCLERCPCFRGVLIEEFHVTCVLYQSIPHLADDFIGLSVVVVLALSPSFPALVVVTPDNTVVVSLAVVLPTIAAASLLRAADLVRGGENTNVGLGSRSSSTGGGVETILPGEKRYV